jgi:hypothetical protein
MRVIDYQKIDLTDAEWGSYEGLVKQFGEDEFKGLFKTDTNGVISAITPSKPVSWMVVFWCQQVMINQHLRENDARIDALEKRINALGGSLGTLTWKA